FKSLSYFTDVVESFLHLAVAKSKELWTEIRYDPVTTYIHFEEVVPHSKR
ncbi:uncharacterized protein FOMMEDRAFT_23177, partial [Fomitiporia mediterranea MF3/22]